MVAMEGRNVTVRIEGVLATTPGSHPRVLHGRVLITARLVWAVLVGQALFLFAASVPAQYNRLSHPPADVQAQLAHAGLSVGLYAAYLTALGVIFALVCCAVAALIIRHRPNDRIGLLASLYLLLLGLTSAPSMQAVVMGYPTLATWANVANAFLSIFLIAFFFLFPDGRFIPRWSGIPVVVCGAGFTLAVVLTGAAMAEDPPDWAGVVLLAGEASGVAAQCYRYLRVSDAVQRQQTKWVVIGVSGAILTAIVFAFAGPLIPSIGRADTGYSVTGVTALTLASLFIPVSLGSAILRHRLWDIDVVINRALVYGALTMGLAGLYVGIVGGLGTLMQVGDNLLLSLFAAGLVAVLFAPLRTYLQTSVNRLMYGERDDPYRVLTRLGARVGATRMPEAVLPVIADTVAHALKSPYAAITLQHPDTPPPATSRETSTGTPLRLPLEYQGETVGELLIAPRGPGEHFSPQDRRLLGDLARQIGPAAYAVHLAADLQRSRGRLVTAREEERRRLRRDLHDGLGPQLAGLILKLETARNRLGHDPVADALLADLTTRAEAAVRDIRGLVYALRPPELDDLGLLPALHAAVEQYGERGLVVVFDAPDSLPPLPAAVESASYRITHEALTNVVKHAGTSKCTVRVIMDETASTLTIEVQDDGRGLGQKPGFGVGLTSMRERTEELGGMWVIESVPGGGTVVRAILPLHQKDERRHQG